MPQAEPGEDLGERNGTAVGVSSDDVRHFSGQASVSAAHLTVGHDRAAEPLAEIQVDEVVDDTPTPRDRSSSPGRHPQPRSPAAQLTSLSTMTCPAMSGRSVSTGARSPTRNGASGRWTSRPVSGRPGRPRLSPPPAPCQRPSRPRPERPWQQPLHGRPRGRPLHVLHDPRPTGAGRVDQFGDHSFGSQRRSPAPCPPDRPARSRCLLPRGRLCARRCRPRGWMTPADGRLRRRWASTIRCARRVRPASSAECPSALAPRSRR